MKPLLDRELGLIKYAQGQRENQAEQILKILHLLGECSQPAYCVSQARVHFLSLSKESNIKLKGLGREIPRSHNSHSSCFLASSYSQHRILIYSDKGDSGDLQVCLGCWT